LLLVLNFSEECPAIYRKLVARKLMEMASKGEKCKKQTIHDRLSLYFLNKGTFSTSP